MARRGGLPRRRNKKQAWTKDDDHMLTETLAEYKEKGLTKKQAFSDLEKMMDRPHWSIRARSYVLEQGDVDDFTREIDDNIARLEKLKVRVENLSHTERDFMFIMGKVVGK